ncbi:DUF6221 family protein [Streptomyces sp. G3]|uniref:DUF6221 family protein n=1 Tax=Streptomyces sp. G3 TaxID=690144 RepID=UPI00202F9C76|nr:DUF6221 family protein [Streptomyces sp. G3]MCM1943163.1 DUF6221 family protein [Streptomyces sp. G3]
MDDLVQWLRAQLDDDERTARMAAEELGDGWYYDDGFVLARREDDMVATGSQDFLEREHGQHIARHDPSRVLREIDAKRQLLDLHSVGGGHECSTRDARGDIDHCTWVMGSEACTTLRLLALPYTDRPGYRDEWRP